MHAIYQLLAVVAAATLTSTRMVRTSSDEEKNFELLILHNNDMHARFEQTSQQLGTCTPDDREKGKCYGGFARVAHVVKEARLAAATGTGPPVLYLNAGDTYTGSAWFTLYKWKIAAEFINAIQPDAMSLGNNEIEKGSTELSPLLRDINVPVLVSNINIKQSEDNEKLQKSIVLDIGDKKVGLVGYLKLNMDILDSTGNVEYIDEILALKEEVARLQEQNVNIIIALGHADLEKDMEIAREVEGIDIVIGGHRNIFSWDNTNANLGKENPEPVIITQQSGRLVLLIQSYAYNQYFGGIKAGFTEDGEIVSYEEHNTLLDSSIPQDTEIVKLYSQLSNEISTRTTEIVGQTAVVLDGSSCRVAECNLGNLITDAMVYYYAVRFEGERWTDAPISVIPGGDIAASISLENRPADVILGDLMTALPTESQIVTVTMTGPVLVQMLEHSISTYSPSNPTGQLLQMSGVRIIYDLEKEPGSRIVSVFVRCWSCFVPEFYVIDDWRDYTVMMPEAMANGEYGYTMLTSLPRQNLVYDEITCTAEFMGLRSPVYPEVGGRIELVNAADVDENVEEDGEEGEDGDGEEDGEDGDGEEDGEEEGDGDDGEDGLPDAASIMSSTALISVLLPCLLFYTYNINNYV